VCVCVRVHVGVRHKQRKKWLRRLWAFTADTEADLQMWLAEFAKFRELRYTRQLETAAPVATAVAMPGAAAPATPRAGTIAAGDADVSAHWPTDELTARLDRVRPLAH
jgi:DNA-binding IclR family transcriptional regulator